MIRNTYDIINDKIEVREDIETTVSGSKYELIIMLVLPVFMVILMKSISEEFSDNFTTVSGVISTLISLGCTAVAYLMGKKILDFKI